MQIKVGTDIDLVAVANELRCKVFVDEQGVPEDEVIDGLNDKAVHVVIFVCSVPIATARVIRLDSKNYKIGLVAVAQSMRGRHLGEKVMRAAMDYISLCNGSNIFLTAQKQAVGFYEKLGFEQFGVAKCLESGFALVPMRRVNKKI